MDLLERYRFPVLNISQFYPRPGTPAARLKRLPTEQVKERSRRVTKFFDSYFPYQGLEGGELKILVTDRGSDGKHFVGHDKCYRHVLIPSEDSYMGKWVKVKVESTGKYYIKGSVVKVYPSFTSESQESAENSTDSKPLKKKVPKLIRGQRGMVKVTDDSDPIDDGAELSLPTPPPEPNVDSSLKDVSKRIFNSQNMLMIGYGLGVSAFIFIFPGRWSFKFALAAFALGSLYHYNADRK